MSCLKAMKTSSITFLLSIFYFTRANEFCERPPEVGNAVPNLEDYNNVFPIGANISYSCEEGYLPNATNYAVCLNNSENAFWELGAVSCISVCHSLPSVPHAKLDLSHDPPYTTNEFVRFTCDHGYEPNTRNSKIFCIGNDSWTPTENICKEKVVSCGDPGYIENAERIGNLFTSPNNVTYVCHEGYKLVGTATKYCSPRMVWIPNSPALCQVIVCPALSDPLNGKVISSQRRLHAVAKYECDRYYNLSGNFERVCQQDGTWSGNRPTCKEITCFDPGAEQYVQVMPSKPLHKAGDIVIFKCLHAALHTSSKCLETGHWSKRPPLCPAPATESFDYSTTTSTKPVPTGATLDQKVLCDAPGEIKNAEITINGLNINSTVTYVCVDGYKLRGKGILICMENGKWDLDKLPMCVKPLSVLSIVGIVIGVILLVAFLVGGFFLYRARERKIQRYGKESKALTTDATDLEEIARLEKGKKPIPVTVL